MSIRTEEMLLNVGPQHPSTHGVFRIVIKIDGEIIQEATPVIGYLHRGTEKLAEDLSYTQIIPYTDRMDYLSAMANNYVICHAAETLMELEIPERAEYLRVIALELNRLSSHCLWYGTFLLDLGATSPFLYSLVERETILDLLNELCGARITFNYLRVGGVKWDAPDGWIEKVKNFLPHMKEKIDEYEEFVTNNEIFINRTKGIGAYTQEQALDYALSGANLRATGIEWDLRKHQPYSIYDRFEFDVPTGKTGDVYEKYRCRMEEMRQSVRILEQAVEQFPSSGPIMARIPRVVRVPEGETYVGIESPRGELGCYIVSKGKSNPWRVRFRRPSFYNLQILPELLRGENVSNLVAILGSIDIVLGEVDA